MRVHVPSFAVTLRCYLGKYRNDPEQVGYRLGMFKG